MRQETLVKTSGGKHKNIKTTYLCSNLDSLSSLETLFFAVVTSPKLAWRCDDICAHLRSKFRGALEMGDLRSCTIKSSPSIRTTFPMTICRRVFHQIMSKSLTKTVASSFIPTVPLTVIIMQRVSELVTFFDSHCWRGCSLNVKKSSTIDDVLLFLFAHCRCECQVGEETQFQKRFGKCAQRASRSSTGK